VLCVLQDSAPSLPIDEIRIVLDEDMGRPIEEIFTEFDDKAIAAASLAQVHRARLLTGEEVAVKIQFPFLRK
jgi:predicted unusual protein kinase regulating ubiquinone biosynthesis (AarF/ABC1/UbiB family)